MSDVSCKDIPLAASWGGDCAHYVSQGIEAYCDQHAGYAEFHEKCCECGGGSKPVTGIGYEKITSGTCESKGKALVTTKDECESAAKELKLSDATADTASIGGLSKGCYWSDGSLLYVPTTTRRSLSGQTVVTMYASVCMHVCVYVCVYVRLYVCMYVCMHVATQLCSYVSLYQCMPATRNDNTQEYVALAGSYSLLNILMRVPS